MTTNKTTFKTLIGYTRYNELIFSEVCIREENGTKTFSASFDAVTPVELTEETIENAVENLLYCYDKSDLYELVEQYDCSPSELKTHVINDCYDVVGEFFDNSLYCETFEFDGMDTIFFESSACGQHDSREGVAGYFNGKELYDLIHNLWDEFHLKTITDNELQPLLEKLVKIDELDYEYELVENWLKEKIAKDELYQGE